VSVQLTVDQRFASDFPQIVVLAPNGEVDLASAGKLRQGLESAESRASSGLVIDLRQVGFIDSTGIGELVGCHRRCREAGRPLAFVVPEGTIRKILKVTGMDSVFDIHADEDSAAMAVSEGSAEVNASE
jgi:anti-sigma B factor antagonist